MPIIQQNPPIAVVVSPSPIVVNNTQVELANLAEFAANQANAAFNAANDAANTVQISVAGDAPLSAQSVVFVNTASVTVNVSQGPGNTANVALTSIAGGGSVLNIGTGLGLTGGPITVEGNISANIATTSEQGITQLVDSISSTDTGNAATANAVAWAFDSANANALAAYATANAAYAEANTANALAQSAYTQANTATTIAEDAYAEANTAATAITDIEAALATANTDIAAAANTVMISANSGSTHNATELNLINTATVNVAISAGSGSNANVALSANQAAILAGVATANSSNVAVTYEANGQVQIDTRLTSGGGTPGGAANDIQFNSSGAFAGSPNLTWSNANSVLTVNGYLQLTNVPTGNFITWSNSVSGVGQAAGWYHYTDIEGAGLWYQIATLPATTSDTLDNLTLDVVMNSGWDASGTAVARISMGNTGGFNVATEYIGPSSVDAQIVAYTQTNGTTNVYAYFPASTKGYTTVNVLNASGGVILYQSTPAESSAPAGTLIYSSAVAAGNNFNSVTGAGTGLTSFGDITAMRSNTVGVIFFGNTANVSYNGSAFVFSAGNVALNQLLLGANVVSALSGANVPLGVASANQSNVSVTTEANGQVQIDYVLGQPGGGGGGGDYQVDTYANGTLVLANANLNWNNTATLNVSVTANGSKQANVAWTANLTAIGIPAIEAALASDNSAFAAINSALASTNTAIGDANAAFGTVNTEVAAAYAQANTPAVATNGTVIVANTANLNFINTVTMNVNVLANGTQSNINISANLTAIGIPAIEAALASDNSAFAAANAAISTLNTYTGTVNTALTDTNSAFSTINTDVAAAYAQANTPRVATNGTAIVSNSANLNFINTVTMNVNVLANGAQANINISANLTAIGIPAIEAGLATINTYTGTVNTAIGDANAAFGTTNTTFGTLNTEIAAAYAQANTPQVATNGTVIVANVANLNFINTATTNVNVLANGTQSNINVSANVAQILLSVVSANTSNITTTHEANGQVQIDYVLGQPGGGGGGGSYQVDTYANGTLVLANANVNWINTATMNVAVVANGSDQVNVAWTANLTAIGIPAIEGAMDNINTAWESAVAGAAVAANAQMVSAQGVLVISNTANLNFLNSATVNATVTQNGTSTQANISLLANLTGLGIVAIEAALASDNAAFATLNTYTGTVNTAIGDANAAFGTTNGTFATLNTEIAGAATSANAQRVAAQGVVVISNTANLNFLNTALINVAVTQNGSGTQANVSPNVNVNAVTGLITTANSSNILLAYSGTGVTIDTRVPTGGGGGSPGGANLEIQYNFGGAFAGNANLMYNVNAQYMGVEANVQLANASNLIFGGGQANAANGLMVMAWNATASSLDFIWQG